MKSFFTLFFCITCISWSFAQPEQTRPKVGLTLSGGGAKGLAHIGILKAIDSAGLKIDYITGTSMGAVLGALYAVGYSGREIEQLIKTMDWDVLLSNQIAIRSLSMEEKNQYARFALELPYSNNKIKLPTGVIEGQELNIKLQELFFHVNSPRNFKDLPIPFKCMATDLETGSLVVLDSGNLVTALRASMAIPSIFTAVSIGDRKLVDGGLVRNFPVKNIIEMGSDITIGSNVSGGLSPKEKISNPIEVLLQMAFYREARDFKQEVPLTDIYIYNPLTKYNMSSFSSAREILLDGDEKGKSFYPRFKQLADSIKSLGFPGKENKNTELRKGIYISGFEVKGLNKTTVPFFIHLMDFYDYKYYTSADISKAIQRAFGSRYYKSITYLMEPINADTARIIFNVEENPGTYLKAGVYYSIFRGLYVNLNITKKDFIIPNSRSMLTLALGESFQLETEHLQYPGRKKNIAVIPGFRMDRLNINTYTNFNRDGSYKQTYYKSYFHIQNCGSNKVAAGVGTSWEYVTLKPTAKSITEQKGNFSYFKSYVYLNYNTLKQTFYPTKGIRFSTEFGLIYDQRSDIRVFQNGQPVVSNLNFDNYSRFVMDGSFYLPVKPKFTLFSELQAGINFSNSSNQLNNFNIGGINGNFRNQVRFAGLQEATVNTATVATLQLGLRYSIYNNIYLIARINGLVKDFATRKNATSNKTFLSGSALTFAYKSPIGPLELSAMYCDQSKQLLSYVTFGIPF